MEPEDIVSSYQNETVDLILDTAKVVYNEEAERFKQVESKTSITLTFIGVLIGFYLSYLSSFTPVTNNTGYLIYTYLFKIVILLLFSLSILFFIRSIGVGKFEQLDLNNIVLISFAKSEPNQSKLEIAQTYKDSIDLNRTQINKKIESYKYGLNIMLIGFLLFIFHFIVEGVIINVIK